MALNQLVDSRDSRFVLFEMLQIEKLTAYDRYAAFDRDSFESVLDLAEQIAVEQVYPANSEGDRVGVVYDPQTKEVAVPEAYKSAMAFFAEAGFAGLGGDPEWGGMGMPDVLCRAVGEYFFAASLSFTAYTSLSVGASNLVRDFTSEDIKKQYLEKVVSGQWGGTMCLTEPEAGSDVGALKTKAVRQDDGTYLITGQKIFITAGEDDLYENIVHPVLARIEGDPPGTKGISIFLVPKFLAGEDGGIGERNDVICSGIEHKMGIKASATCTLNFGDNGRCVGYLMGEARQGMRIMFHMMNEARLDVAIQGLGVASSAYMHAVTYAKNRLQGADPARRGDPGKQVPIVSQPDVRRMLLSMKSQVEAMRMLCMLAAYSTDLKRTDTGETAREAGALLDFLIPICKAGNSDLAWMITGEAIQVYGGYGYCSEYPVEQLARDSKILSIYEGTNGIQSLDLTMRKLLMNPDLYNYTVFKKRIRETVEAARDAVEDTYVAELQDGLDRMDEVIDFLNGYLTSGKILEILARATPLQQAFRMLAHAWMHLWSLSICMPKLRDIIGDVEGDELAQSVAGNPEAAYYYGKVLSGRFYLGSEFKKYYGLLDYVLSGETAVVDSFDATFTGALEE